MATAEAAEMDREVRARGHARESFADHEMTVMEDNGKYRHLRFARPGEHSWDHWFEIVTWPGRTFVGGDIEDFVFCRGIELFDRPDINPQHWAEKLTGHGSAGVRTYSRPMLDRQVEEAFAEAADGRPDGWLDEVRAAWSDHVSWTDMAHEWPAAEATQNFKHGSFTFCDGWEWDLKDWDYHFLLSCWAAWRGAAIYRASLPPVVREGDGDDA